MTPDIRRSWVGHDDTQQTTGPAGTPGGHSASSSTPDSATWNSRTAWRGCWSYPDHPVILLDDGLTQVERNAALAHELVHLERGWPCRAPWAEEERVHDEVARRLVPLDQLHRWVVERERSDLNVEVWEVADVWWVPDVVASCALRLLYQRIRVDIPC